jgi:hypothetical protein
MANTRKPKIQKLKRLLWRNAVVFKFALRLGAALLAVVLRGVDVTREQHWVHLLEYHSHPATRAHHDGVAAEGL